MQNYIKHKIFFIIFIFLFFHNSFSQRNFVDEVGRKVTVSDNPERIISLAPDVTEILFALGIGENIVGVTNYCDYPESAKKKQKIGGMIDPNLEVIISLKPDLIIASRDGNKRGTVEQLENFGKSVYTINPRNIEEVFVSIKKLGEILNKSQTAEKIINNGRDKLNKIRAVVQNAKTKPKVLFLISISPIFTAGKNTFIDNLINLSGGENIAGDMSINYPQFSLEEVIKRKPDIIILPVSNEDEFLRAYSELKKSWLNVSAVSNKKIFDIDANSVLRATPRLVDGLEQLMSIVHPELFIK